MMSSGCVAAFGVKPDRQDFLDDAQAACVKYHPQSWQDQRACLEFEKTYQWASKSRTTYISRARANEWAVYFGGAVAMVSAGALGGFAAFGQTASDAYKIIPLVGAFVGGALAFFNNDEKAAAYYEAEASLEAALMEAERTINPSEGVGRDVAKYNAALDVLGKKIEALESALREKLMKNLKRVSKEDSAQLQDKLRTLTLANRYRMVGVRQDPTKQEQIIVTLSAGVDQQDVSSLLSIAKLRIADRETTPSSINKESLIVPIPVELRKSGNAVPQGVGLLIGDVVAGGVITVYLTFP
jgi:hypothetical protein